MTFDISLDKRIIFAGKNFLRNLYCTLWITASIFILLMPVKVFTQRASDKSEQSIKKLQIRFGLSDQHVDQLRPLIRQQAIDLGKIFNDFSELSDSSYFPFWINADMWLELRESRKKADNSSLNLTQNQRRALLAAYTMLESEMLSNLLDEQMTALAEDLELTEAQSQNIYEILAGCLEQDRQLVSNLAERPNSIREKLNVVSTETDRKIERIPTPTPTPSPTPGPQSQKGVGLWTLCRPPAIRRKPLTLKSHLRRPTPVGK